MIGRVHLHERADDAARGPLAFNVRGTAQHGVRLVGEQIGLALYGHHLLVTDHRPERGVSHGRLVDPLDRTLGAQCVNAAMPVIKVGIALRLATR